jgi:hypothetical protein
MCLESCYFIDSHEYRRNSGESFKSTSIRRLSSGVGVLLFSRRVFQRRLQRIYLRWKLRSVLLGPLSSTFCKALVDGRVIKLSEFRTLCSLLCFKDR